MDKTSKRAAELFDDDNLRAAYELGAREAAASFNVKIRDFNTWLWNEYQDAIGMDGVSESVLKYVLDAHTKTFNTGTRVPSHLNGDVLASPSGNILILYDKEYEGSIFSPCSLVGNMFKCRQERWARDIWTPATIRQRERLFDEMRKHGYMWDSNEIVKID